MREIMLWKNVCCFGKAGTNCLYRTSVWIPKGSRVMIMDVSEHFRVGDQGLREFIRCNSHGDQYLCLSDLGVNGMVIRLRNLFPIR